MQSNYISSARKCNATRIQHVCAGEGRVAAPNGKEQHGKTADKEGRAGARKRDGERPEHQHQRVKDNMYTVCILKIMPHCKFTAIVVHLLHVFTQYWLLLLQLLLLLLLLLPLSLDERCNGIPVAHTLTHIRSIACRLLPSLASAE